MRAIVTGDTGFLGYELYNQLKDRGHEVFGISRSSKDYCLDIVKCSQDKLNEIFEEIRPDYLFHYAGNPLIADNTNELSLINTIGTHKLLDSVNKNCKVVFASSAAVYDSLRNERPNSVYGAQKLYSENLIKIYAKCNKINNYCIIRYVAHCGKYATHGLCKDVVNKLIGPSKNLELLGNKPGSIKPILHVKNSIDITLKYALDYKTYGLYNLAPPDNISVEDAANTIMKELCIYKNIIWGGSTWFGDQEYLYIRPDFSGVNSSKQAIIDYVKEIR